MYSYGFDRETDSTPICECDTPAQSQIIIYERTYRVTDCEQIKT